ERQTSAEEAYLLHPTLIDGAFQALVALSQKNEGETTAPMVPVAIERFSFNRPARTVVYVFAKLSQADDSQLTADLNFFEEDGECLATMQGVKCRRISSGDQTQEDLGRYFYDHTWEEKALEDLSPRQGVEQEQWLILADQHSAGPLGQEFTRRGIPHLVAVSGEKTRLKGKQLVLNPNDRDGMLELVKLKAKSGLSHILHLWNLHSTATRDVQGELVQSTMQLRNLIEALRDQLGEQKLNVISVTSAAHVVTPDDRGQNLTAAPLSAFGRLIENEYANIRFQHFDFEDEPDFRKHALQLLLADSNEREVALRSKTLWLRRLKRAPQLGMAERRPTQRFHSSEHCLELQMPLPDAGESVFFHQRSRNKPKAEEVEIQLNCASLQPNRLQAPKTPGDLPPIFSFSGTISQIGSGVGHLQIGDTVMGIGTGPLRSFLLAPAQNLILKPQGVSVLEATGLAELLEAYYALTQLARLKKGEKIWIGNAAGSTGLAAIEIAKWIGAEIFVGVPSAEIFQYLKMRGVEKIYTGNGPALEDDLIADTQGQGMDVVLHIGPDKTLAGRFGAVAPCGRIVELGQRQGQTDVFLPQIALQKNLTFAVADFQRMLVEKPHLCGQLLAVVARHLATGSFRPASVKAISADQIGDLLRVPPPPMGGLAVTFADTEITAETEAETPLFRKDGTYLVTGGSKGFGLEVARWIAQQGGGTLVLASRSGADASSQQALSEMTETGVQVLIRQTDIGDEDAIRNLISDIGSTLPPLRGVFHAAVVLEDALLSDLTAGSLARTLHAKVGGLLHLDKHTRNCPLDFFMTFSSVSALIGNAGQTAYVVGNAFLDAFAQYRRSQGLPATSIDFGAIADVGILKKRIQVEDFFRRHGILSMKPALTCQLLGRALRTTMPVVGIFDVEWATLAPAMPIIHSSPVFSELVSHAGGNGAAGNGQLEALNQQLTELEPEAQESWLSEQIAKEVSQILGMSMEKIDLNERFANMGIDSLSAVELGVGLRESLGAEFSTVNLLNLASVTRLTNEIFDQLRSNAKVN
ncbi:MAG: SDR family NAD(P)-dependent oxidoreductase, partial [Desulfuromonadaceae bacterium]